MPGRSGNPGGRSKTQVDIQALARQHGPAAIAALAQALKSRNERVRVAAAAILLDRGYGRAPQALTIEGEQSSVHLHWIAAKEIASSLPLIDAKPEPVDTKTLHLFDQPEE
jgi:hypothetical protein